MTDHHDVARDLARSRGLADAPRWRELYRQAFGPPVAGRQYVRQDGWAHRGGIDRQVFLTDGTVLTIHAKVRDEVRDDSLLEYWSDEARQKPGWISNDLTCDYIAYVFRPSRRCFLRPVPLLQRA